MSKPSRMERAMCRGPWASAFNRPARMEEARAARRGQPGRRRRRSAAAGVYAGLNRTDVLLGDDGGSGVDIGGGEAVLGLVRQVRDSEIALQERLLVDCHGQRSVTDALGRFSAYIECRYRDFEPVFTDILGRGIGRGISKPDDAADARVRLKSGADQGEILPLIAGGHEILVGVAG